MSVCSQSNLLHVNNQSDTHTPTHSIHRLTMPQGRATCVKEGALLVVMVTVVGIEVTGDYVLEVSVLPVQVTGLNGPCEHSPMGAHLC